MIAEALNITGISVFSYGMLNIGANAITAKYLSGKPKEEIKSMKSWKVSSLLKKIGYVIFPGAYFAVDSEKRKIIRLEREIKNELMERYDPNIQEELGLEKRPSDRRGDIHSSGEGSRSKM